MPVVTERWIGGTLTNFSVIRSRLRRLEELETMEEDGSMEIQYSKKMVSTLRRERRKIERNLGGIREMSAHPRRDGRGRPRPRGQRRARGAAHGPAP